jgi:hypothetical protein
MSIRAYLVDIGQPVTLISDHARETDKVYATTQGDAHKCGRDQVPAYLRDEVRIEEVEIATDKGDIIDILNGKPPRVLNMATRRRWSITTRGGLRALPPGGDD